MPLRFGSVCSGIEAASVAWNPIGWEAAWFSEIEPFPCALLKERYPDVPNLGDMTQIADRIKAGEVEAPDMLCGGTPCFTAGHYVLTGKGYVPIEDVRAGDWVMTHKGRLQRVLRAGKKMAQIGTLYLEGHRPVTCTPDHPFLSATPAGLSWIRAEDLPGLTWCALPAWDTGTTKPELLQGFNCRKAERFDPVGEAEVFNIEVECDNSYILEGIASHNCQSFSLAGQRKSLDDNRGNLALVFCNLADAIDEARIHGRPRLSNSTRSCASGWL